MNVGVDQRLSIPSVRKEQALEIFSGLSRHYDRLSALFSLGQDPRWRRAMVATVRASPEDCVLDVATGTGLVATALVRRYGCSVVGLDQSEQMLAVAREQAPAASFVLGDALQLPFEDDTFDRVFTGHFYGHLEDSERERFVAQAYRVAPQLVVADAIRRSDRDAEEWQERVLNDGSRWQVYKRYFEPEQLVEELGGGRVLLANRWFVVVVSP
jgi:demethylmenaquinone methyltransferase/2-methoxy-6-polyprenyl-1,4-benzoquinol methylase